MARKRKEPETPAATADRVRAAIEKDTATPEIIRDAFLEGRDREALTLMRQLDGKNHRKAAAMHAQKADECMKNIPPNCMGAIPKVLMCGEHIAAAREHLNMLPHEYRAPNEAIFGLVNRRSNEMNQLRFDLAGSCTGTLARRGHLAGRRKKGR